MDLDKKENTEKSKDSKKETKKSYKWGILSFFIDILCEIGGCILNFIGNLSQFFGT